MIESQNPEIDVQELMARVRAEVERRKAPPPAAPARPLAAPGSPPVAAVSPFRSVGANITAALDRARQKNQVSSRIPAFIHPFFRNQGGFNYQLLHAAELQTRQLEVLRDELANLQQASYGEAADLRAAHADSLNQIKELQAQTAKQVLALNAILKEQQAQADSLDQIRKLQTQTTKQVLALNAILKEQQAQVDSLDQIRKLQAETSEQVSTLSVILKEQQVQHDSTRQQIPALESRLTDLIDRVAPKITSLDADAFYLAFENQFRGTREDIKARQRVYLPYLAKAGAGTADKPILDLGCGRGEWLGLLRESGHTARGVDSNASMISVCRELGLDVVASDVLAYLKSLPDQSQRVITGFHIIEHLPFPVLLELFAHTRRVLQTGGVAIFETPNPLNVLVGSNRFYTDPTHLRPLPLELSKFMAERVGFRSVTILSLHPDVVRKKSDALSQEFTDFINAMFFGPQDYAVVAEN